MPIIKKEQIYHLKGRLDIYLEYTWKKYKIFSRGNLLIKVLAVVSASLVSLFTFLNGYKDQLKFFMDFSILAGVTSIFVTFLITLEGLLKLGETANHYLRLHSRAKNLRDKLYYEPENEGDPLAIQVSREFMDLKKMGVDNMPTDGNLSEILSNDTVSDT